MKRWSLTLQLFVIGALLVAGAGWFALHQVLSVQPFIERVQHRLVVLALSIVAAGLVLGGLLSWWLSRAIRRLTDYADAVTAGARPAVPELPGVELQQLASALDTMRARLEGKAYVERYVQTLTHELKSPLAALRGAAELLRRELPAQQRERLLDHIELETERLQAMSERLLHLAQVEQRRALEERVRIELAPLLEELLRDLAPRLMRTQVSIANGVVPGVAVLGERFLVRQAIANLLDNAVDFTAAGRCVTVNAGAVAGRVALKVFNEGEPVPDYALPRLTERFYSLPRPGSGRKSTGLGLNLVQEVAQLHGGAFAIGNEPGGVGAVLQLPAA